MSNISIWLINRTLSSASILGLSGLESNNSDGVLHISQNSKGALPSDGLMSYLGHLFVGGGSYSFAEMQQEYSTDPADWAGGEEWWLG